MTLAFTAPAPTRSLLSRADPRWKLAALLWAAGIVAALHRLPVAVTALMGIVLLALLARLPPRWLASRLAALGLFLALFAVPLPWLLPENGVETALLLSAKAIALAMLFLIVQATAPLESTLKAARSLRVPGLLVQLSLLTYRHVFVLAEELRRLRIALRVRGYRSSGGRHRYRTAGRLAGTLLLRGYERAERVGQAMRCRAFDGQFRSLHCFATRPLDVFLFVVIASAATILAAWDRWPRLWG